jgi:hypothetical protein
LSICETFSHSPKKLMDTGPSAWPTLWPASCPPTVLPNPALSKRPIGSMVGVGGPKPRPLRSCRGDDPSVTVVMTIPSSEGTVLIDDRWETLTGVELAAVLRAGPPS